jgi:hypothetical protein
VPVLVPLGNDVARELPYSGAREPDKLAAQRAGIHHAQIADERDEPARAAIRTRWADSRSGGLDSGHAQKVPRSRTGNRVGAGLVPQYARFPIVPGMVPEKAVEQIGA